MPKNEVELVDCLHSIRTHTEVRKTKHFRMSARTLVLFLLGAEFVTNLSRSFTQLNSAHSDHSGIRILAQKM